MAGTVAKTYRPLDQVNVFPKSMELLIEWVADASAHTVPATLFSDLRGWFITKIITIPGAGAAAPTDLYDITFIDVDGLDILAGALADLSDTVSKEFQVSVPIGYDGFTFTLANNSVDSASGTVRVFLSR
jgi:hypothetical protein